jgi:hypothetical protein
MPFIMKYLLLHIITKILYTLPSHINKSTILILHVINYSTGLLGRPRGTHGADTRSTRKAALQMRASYK